MDGIRLGSFTPSVLLDVTRRLGRLDGLAVEEIAVTSSPAQFSSLASGELDAVFTSPDNVIAYRFITANPLGRRMEIETVAGIDRGLGLSLGLRPGLEAPAPGIRFGVDVPNSGFAFVGYALLAQAGLAPGSYSVVTLGSTPARAAALLDGGCDVTILGAGNELRARAAGCTITGSTADLGPYVGTVLARLLDAPAAAGTDALAAALMTTAADIVAGRFATEVASSAERVLGLSPARAIEHAEIMRDPSVGLIPDGAIGLAALTTLVDLRRRFLPDPDLDAADLSLLSR